MCDAVIIGQVKFRNVNPKRVEYLKSVGAVKCKCRKKAHNTEPQQEQEVVESVEVVDGDEAL